MRSLTVTAVPGVPMIQPGDALDAMLIAAVEAADIVPCRNDVLVVAQKIVSKAEGRYVTLDEVIPSERAKAIGLEIDKDPRLVEVILSESDEVVAQGPGMLIMAHRLGHVMANAGIDRSNIEHPPGSERERVLLLPEDPDASAAHLKHAFDQHFDTEVAVIINDSVGRAWRNGTVGLALGVAGLPALEDLRGNPDLHGRPLLVSLTGLADEAASAAALVMGEADEALPLAHIRGLRWQGPASGVQTLIRPKDQDLFR